MFYRCQRFTINRYKVKRKGSKRKELSNRRLPWSGAPDSPVCHRTVSGAPERSTPNLPPSGFWKCHSAIIHRTVRCSTGLSGVPAVQRSPAQQSSSTVCSQRYNTRTARAESEQTPEGAPDSEQYLSGAPPDCPVAESAFIPFVSFGDLDNNTFKGLTSLLSVEQEIQYDEHT
jgi:hypothetical protein